MTAQAFANLIADLHSAGAQVLVSRHGEDNSFIAARRGDRAASVDVFWDDNGQEVANVCVGDGDELEKVVRFKSPGFNFGRDVVHLLGEDAAR